MSAAKGTRALFVAFVLGVLALGGASTAFFVGETATLMVLSVAACVAFAALIAAVVSFRGRRLGPSIAATLASLVILAGIASGFGTVSVQRFMAAVERNQPPPPEPIVDEDFRFELAPIASDARMYGAHEAEREIHERALAATWSATRETELVVHVEPTYGLPLHEAAREQLAIVNGTPSWESAWTPAELAGLDAIRIRQSFGEGDAQRFEESTLAARGGWLYHLSARRWGANAPGGDVWFPDVGDALSLHDGEVTPRFSPPIPLHDAGPGWSVRDGVFESAAWGVRVDASDATWGLSWRDGVPDFRDGAIVELSRRRPDVQLTVGVEHALGDAATALAELEGSPANWATASDAPVRTVSVGGRALEWRSWRWGAPRTRHARIAAWTDGTRSITLTAWSRSEEALEAALEDAAARVTILEGDALETAREAHRDTPWHDVGDAWWVRDDTLASLHDRARWRRPGPRWRADWLGWGGSDGGDGFARIEAPEHGVVGTLTRVAAEGRDACEAHRAGSLDPETSLDGATSNADGSRCTATGVPVPSGWHVAWTALRVGDSVYLMELWATPANAARHEAAIRAALDGLHAPPLEEPAGWVGATSLWRDPRFGFELDSLLARATLTVREQRLSGDVGTHVELAEADDVIALMAAPLDPFQTPGEQAEALLDEHYRFIVTRPGEWTDRDGTLDGRPAHVRELSIPFGLGGTTIVRCVHRGALFVLLVRTVGSHPDAAEVMNGFRWID